MQRVGVLCRWRGCSGGNVACRGKELNRGELKTSIIVRGKSSVTWYQLSGVKTCSRVIAALVYEPKTTNVAL